MADESLRATMRLPGDAEGVAEAARLLAAGEVVAIPTETVYGLAADAGDRRAVAAVFEAKGRPSFNPLIVHVRGAEEAGRFAVVPARAEHLMEAFWPGPLTLALPLREGAGLSPLVTAGLKTVALRAPAHPLARGVLAALGRPVAAPSANPSGRVSPTTAGHVLAGLEGRIAAVLDGGACEVGMESTILGVAEDGPVRLLREGGVSREALEEVLGEGLVRDTDPARVAAPGQMASHYAPRGHLRLNAVEAEPGEVLLGFGPIAGDFSLSATGDLHEAAARLFGLLHEMDARGAERIAVAPIPEEGLGRAINDRLRRAAAPR